MKLSLILLVFVSPHLLSQQVMQKRTLKLMGSRFDITLVAEDVDSANMFIDEAVNEITRIERMISSWDPNSQTSKINANAGIAPVEVDPELFDLIDRCKHISALTSGAFDISYASIDKLWHFDGTMKEKPSDNAIAKSVSLIGYENILLNHDTHQVFLKRRGMKIGFGAIGKGYAADKAKNLLMDKGVIGGIINAAGDMNTWGKQYNGQDWQVAITNPMDKSKAYGMLPLAEGAVVTSGNYEKYVTFNGIRYTHIIDPRSGYPATGIISATVFAPKAELADALATAIFVMGIETGLDFVNQISKIECILIDDSGKIFTSKNIELETKSTSKQK